MKFIDWFAGIGGIRLGLERAGHACVWSCEIDKFARAIYGLRFGHKPEGVDIHAVRASDIPDADLWAGGFPCQDVSLAGRRAGIDGARSGTIWSLLDLAAAARRLDAPARGRRARARGGATGPPKRREAKPRDREQRRHSRHRVDRKAPAVTDDSIRSLEHALQEGDEGARRLLEVAYRRKGAVETLSDDIVRAVGSRIIVFSSIEQTGSGYLAPCVQNWFRHQLLRRFADSCARTPSVARMRADVSLWNDGDEVRDTRATANGVTVLLGAGATRCDVFAADEFVGRSLLTRAMSDSVRMKRLCINKWKRRVTASTPLFALWSGLTCDVLAAEAARIDALKAQGATDYEFLMRGANR